MINLERTEIYENYKNMVYGYLISNLGHKEEAEDLCNDVFVKVYAHLDSYDSSKSSMSTWIYRITRNTLYDYYRTTHQTTELDLDIASDDDFVDKICNDETVNTLVEALKKLPDKERDLILLHYYHNETLKDIAVRLDISYSYAKILHNKAIADLRTHFTY